VEYRLAHSLYETKYRQARIYLAFTHLVLSNATGAVLFMGLDPMVKNATLTSTPHLLLWRVLRCMIATGLSFSRCFSRRSTSYLSLLSHNLPSFSRLEKLGTVLTGALTGLNSAMSSLNLAEKEFGHTQVESVK
jgi:hypothetical protein